MAKPFTKEEDYNLVKYIAVNNPGRQNRLGNTLYRQLVENTDGHWPWAEGHSWSSWLAHYKSKQGSFDRRIRKYQDNHAIARSPSLPLQSPSNTSKLGRRLYTDKDDRRLIAFLAEIAPLKQGTKLRAKLGRKGNHIYQSILCGNPNKYPWALTHSWQSWRGRYVANEQAFDERIERWQEERGIEPARRAHDNIFDKKNVDLPEVEVMSEEHEMKESQYDSSSEYSDKRRRQDNDESDAECASQPHKKPKVSVAQSSYQAATHVSPPPEEFNPTSEMLLPRSPDPSPQYPPLPQSTITGSSRILGTDPQSLRNIDATSRHARPEPTSNGLLHPTTPPTNLQSEGSVQSSALVPDPPASPSSSQRRSHSGIVGSNFPRPNTTHPPQKRLEQHPNSRFTPSTPGFCPSSSPSCSDGPFATSPPTARRTVVIRGIPKPRPGRSFRDNDRVRPRNVLLGDDDHNDNMKQRIDFGNKASEERRPPTRDTSKSVVSEDRMWPQLYNTTLTDEARIMGNVTKTITHQHAKQVIPSDIGTQHRPHAGIDVAPKAPNSSPCPAVPSVSDSTAIHSHRAVHQPNLATFPADVFATQTPIASGSNRDPYVLGTSHLPESCTDSTISRVRPGSPAPRQRKGPDRHRRRTFTGFDFRSGLPDIDLVEKLGKRSSSRLPAFTLNRGSSVSRLNHAQSAASSHPLLTAQEHTAARRGPPRKSAIPILVGKDDQDTVPLSLDQLSSSTSGLIIKVGLSAIFKQMELNHGFSADVVERAWRKQNMDIHATDRMLLRMRIAAENASQGDPHEILAHFTPPVIEKYSNHNLAPMENKYTEPHSSPASSLAAAYPVEYRPPPHSRADHYLRLSEQGRIWEARQREIELATVVSVDSSPTKDALSKQSTTPVSKWSDHDDMALQNGDETVILGLVQKFGEDVIRRKFLIVMRQSCG